jgi:AraC-like DNA-binding protein
MKTNQGNTKAQPWQFAKGPGIHEQPIDTRLHPYLQRMFYGELSTVPKVLLPGPHCLFIFACHQQCGEIVVEGIGREVTKHYPNACFVGPRDRWIKIGATAPGPYLFILFRPGSFHKLMKKHCVKFQNNAVSNLDICRYTFERIQRELYLSDDPAQFIQRFLLSIATPVTDSESGIIFERLVNIMTETSNSVPIRQLCELLQVNQKRAERIFQRYMGLNPKSFQRVQRYIHAHEQITSGEKDYRQIAKDCGYHDLPHMIKEFKNISGLTPSKYLSVMLSGNFLVPHACFK